MVGLGVLALLAVEPGTPLAGQSLERQSLWCGEDPTLPNERPELEDPEALDQLGRRLFELLNSTNLPRSTLYFRGGTGEIHTLEGVVDLDVWFCVDQTGTVSGTRVSGFPGGLEPNLEDPTRGLRFRPSLRNGIPRTGVATLTFLLTMGDQDLPRKIIGQDRGNVPIAGGEVSGPSERKGGTTKRDGGEE